MNKWLMNEWTKEVHLESFGEGRKFLSKAPVDEHSSLQRHFQLWGVPSFLR